MLIIRLLGLLDTNLHIGTLVVVREGLHGFRSYQMIDQYQKNYDRACNVTAEEHFVFHVVLRDSRWGEKLEGGLPLIANAKGESKFFSGRSLTYPGFDSK